MYQERTPSYEVDIETVNESHPDLTYTTPQITIYLHHRRQRRLRRAR